MQYKLAHAWDSEEIRVDKNGTGRILDYFLEAYSFLW